MRLHILSDLHVDAHPFTPSVPEGTDIICLAGDSADGITEVTYPLAHLAPHHVIGVFGNHSYRGKKLPKLFQEAARLTADSHVTMLENACVIRQGVRFLGATLWTDFATHPAGVAAGRAGASEGDPRQPMAFRGMKEYRTTRVRFGSSDYRRLTPAMTESYHRRTLKWLATQFAQPHAGPTVVITHHAPTRHGLSDAQRTHVDIGDYASDLDTQIQAWQPDLWIFGHTHQAVDLHIGRTRMISNPRGKPGESTGFRPDLTVDVGGTQTL